MLLRIFLDFSALKQVPRVFLYNMSNTRDSVSTNNFPNTENRVENMTCTVEFLTRFEVHGKQRKHHVSCLIYHLNQHKN